MCSQEEIKAIKGVLSPPQEKIIKAHLIDIKQGENGPELILYVGREERTLPFPMLIHPFSMKGTIFLVLLLCTVCWCGWTGCFFHSFIHIILHNAPY